MRRFSSYGPVEPRFNFCVERRALVERCVAQLVGEQDEGGHYFTLWAPRQTGKTWIMRRALSEIQARHGERFQVGTFSMQAVVLEDDAPEEAFFQYVPQRFQVGFHAKVAQPKSWAEWVELFSRSRGAFDRPVILCIDEFDSLPPKLIDRLVALFRDMFLARDEYFLHGLALVGVRAVLGVDSKRGSPFNVQRSLHVPNLTQDEVTELFAQYQAESGQAVQPELVSKVFQVTRGQPGLTSWFGELLTEKYNAAPAAPLTLQGWQRVFAKACHVEHNNTVLNLIAKAKEHPREVAEVFTRANIPFSFDKAWCNFLHMNGVLDFEEASGDDGLVKDVCRFSSPFVQQRLYAAFSDEMNLDSRVPVVDPWDDLTEVFAQLDLPALLRRYCDYLKRLDKRGVNPWHGQPRRADLHIAEAAGHFHLYWWLLEASKGHLTVSPEFPTGNGKVDLHVSNRERSGVIEVKSFTQRSDLPVQKAQAARYAKSRGIDAATMALFAPTDDEELLRELSRQEVVEGVSVTVVAISAV